MARLLKEDHGKNALQKLIEIERVLALSTAERISNNLAVAAAAVSVSSSCECYNMNGMNVCVRVCVCARKGGRVLVCLCLCVCVRVCICVCARAIVCNRNSSNKALGIFCDAHA